MISLLATARARKCLLTSLVQGQRQIVRFTLQGRELKEDVSQFHFKRKKLTELAVLVLVDQRIKREAGRKERSNEDVEGSSLTLILRG